MAITKSNMTWSCKQVAKMATNGTFEFDNIIQRSLVWEQARKSNLIHSLIEGFPIPPFYAKRVDGKVYDFLDGKQRINAIQGFINGEYRLYDIPQITYTNDEGEEVTEYFNGYKFDDLPEVIQDAIKDSHIVVYYFEDITDEQVQMMFGKLNNGKPLTAKERNIAYCKDIMTVTEIGKHALFSEILTTKGLEQRKQLPIVMKIWIMLNSDIEDVSFATADFNEVMSNTKISDAERAEIETVLDKFREIYHSLETWDNPKIAKVVRKRMVSETHMISLVPFVKKFIDDETDMNQICEIMVALFGGDVIVSDTYAESCKGGSAKSTNIRRRHEEIEKAIDEIVYKNLNETA